MYQPIATSKDPCKLLFLFQPSNISHSKLGLRGLSGNIGVTEVGFFLKNKDTLKLVVERKKNWKLKINMDDSHEVIINTKTL